MTVLEDSTDEQTGVAIRRLWSCNAEERKLGSQQLTERGVESIGPLVSLLSDLLSDQRPRFALGREDEAARALDYIRESLQNPISADEMDKAAGLISDLFINSRLIADVISLLGELRAEGAIPSLIRIMEGRDMYSEPDGYAIEAQALLQIGAPAVPFLIKALDEAKTTAIKGEDIYLGCVIHCDSITNLRDDEDNLTIRSEQHSGEEDDDDDYDDINTRFYKIQRRAIRVLGDIGDPKALPFLRSLVEDTRDARLVSEIEMSITKIQKKPDEVDLTKADLLSPQPAKSSFNFIAGRRSIR